MMDIPSNTLIYKYRDLICKFLRDENEITVWTLDEHLVLAVESECTIWEAIDILKCNYDDIIQDIKAWDEEEKSMNEWIDKYSERSGA